MSRWLEALVERMLAISEPLLLLILGLAAMLENLVPPIPADTVILFGGFLVGQGAGTLWIAILVVWFANVAGAMLTYGLGRSYGPRFFTGRIGRLVLKPRQLATLSAFYQRYGFVVIFVSRFLPVFRSLVPAFAGVSRLSAVGTAIPVTIASGLWYGTLLYLGALAGQNWEQVAAAIAAGGRWLYLPIAVLALLIARWWWRSRHEHPE